MVNRSLVKVRQANSVMRRRQRPLASRFTLSGALYLLRVIGTDFAALMGYNPHPAEPSGPSVATSINHSCLVQEAVPSDSPIG